MNAANDNLFNPTDRMLRQFAAISIVFFGAIAARQEFHHHRHGLAIVFAVLAVTVGPLGLTWPRVIKPVFIGWMAFAYPIGWTVSRIVLGVIFYGLFTPVAWVFRLIGRDELALKSQPTAATYWRPKPSASDQSQYLRQF
jgi:saxitoxin biosynthesis operon SxtJ-like protein